MSKFANLVRTVDGHSIWGVLPRKARRELAKFYDTRKRWDLGLPERDERLNKILRRHGRADLQIIRPHNRADVVAARLERAA